MKRFQKTIKNNPPESISELLNRVGQLQGLSVGELFTHFSIPQHCWKKKGLFGQAIEWFLGANAQNEASPDFKALGVELKSIPINIKGEPKESTFVTSINLQTIGLERWHSSQVHKKLSHVLWLPFEADDSICLSQRRIGKGFLWKPTDKELHCLENDWNEITELLSTGRIVEVSASLGKALQIRPKAASGFSLCVGHNEQGHRVQTLPRGFYLRKSFTKEIIRKKMNESLGN